MSQSSYTPPTGTTLPSTSYNLNTIMYRPGMTEFSPIIHKGIQHTGGPNNPLISEHRGGVNVTLTDGSVRFMSYQIDLLTLKNIATRDNDGKLGMIPAW